ncbi:hypothetical protein BDN70DRAFT_890831 [Pholiota conissans]|uniref:DUF6534 domain-containing protein n=1 Tax=Pholiota conissans TaxID=109636 RepID=A0A9P6D6D8_9AGAR|nr:hypothetical protein BDN70DRAFT_890831 [Pholiota conissans]
MAEESINLAQIAGPLYLGILLNVALYGVLVVQVYIYWVAFRKDRFHVKALVYGLFLIDTVQSILLLRDGFVTFGSGFGDIDGLDQAHLEWFSVPYTTAVVSCIVQCFFAYRIYVLSGKSLWVPGAIVLSSLTQGIAAIMAGTKDLRIHLYSLLQKRAVVEITVWHIGTAFCDVLIALSMCYYLYKRDSRHQHTHEIIVKLIQLTVETGTATATVAIVDLILFLAAPGKIYFVTPSFIAAKLYANTVVVIFNNRAQFIKSSDQPATSQGERSRVGNRMQTNRINLVQVGEFNGAKSYPAAIEVQKSVSVWDDGSTRHGDRDVELSGWNYEIQKDLI